MKKRVIFRIHSIAGLFSGLFILLMSLSGSVLVFHDQLDQKPEVVPVSSGRISTDSCYKIIQHHYPMAQISSCGLWQGYNEPVSFFIYDPSYKQGEKAMEVFLHPQTGAILKTRGGSDDWTNNFMSWLSKFHNSFHLAKAGEWTLGFFSLVFLISLFTGFILFRKKIVSVLLFRKTAWRRDNLHQLVGVYALLFNLLIAFTGFWMQRYVFERDFYRVYDYKMAVKPSPAFPYRFDSAYSEIKKKVPGFYCICCLFFAGYKRKDRCLRQPFFQCVHSFKEIRRRDLFRQQWCHRPNEVHQ